MPNRKYERGRRLEWQVRDFFREHGYWVLRSAGSKHEADLVAIKPAKYEHREEECLYPKVLLIQCKATMKRGDAQEKIRLQVLARELNCIPVWASKTDKGKLHLERLDEFGIGW